MAKMKRSEKFLWLMVAVALAANIWLPRHLRLKYSWERDLSQRIAADLTRPDTLVTGHKSGSYENAGTPPPSGQVHPRFAAAEYGPDGVALPSEARQIRVRYQITVPKGPFRLRENLRCWLPFPQGAKLIEAGVNGVPFPEDKIILSGTSSPHGSLYMETRSSRYKDITFHEVYEYQYEPLFHPGRSEESDVLARWIRDSITQAPMKEYSTIEDIPGKVKSEKRGDEGGLAVHQDVQGQRNPRKMAERTGACQGESLPPGMGRSLFRWRRMVPSLPVRRWRPGLRVCHFDKQ